MRHKPTFVLHDDNSSTGIKVVHDYFVSQHGYTQELVRTLVVKYPYILSKTAEELDKTFATLAENGIEHADAVKLIFDCPKLLSIDLEKQMAEVFYLFELYHRIEKSHVMDIF